MKRLIFLSLTLALVMTKAFAYTAVAGFDGPTWYDYRATNYAGGSGSQSNPYQISTPEQLAKMAYEVNVNGAGGYYKLTADISLNKRFENIRVLWVPIGISENKPFNGTLTNPDGHVIEGMMIKANSTETTSYFGLFGYVTGTVDGIIMNEAEISVTDVSTQYWVGLICGELNKGNVKNCEVQGYINAKGIGFLTNTTTNNQYTTITTQSKVFIGGVVGRNSNYFYEGTDYGSFTSCVSKVEINIDGSSDSMTKLGAVAAGGVVGLSFGHVVDCHAVLKMTAKNLSKKEYSCLGGVVGYSYNNLNGSITNIWYCSASGEMTVEDQSHTRTGGLIGCSSGYRAQLFMKYCATSVTLTGGHTLGGMIGQCYQDADISNKAPRRGVHLKNNLCSSYIDARNATYAGGCIGEVASEKSFNYEYHEFTESSEHNYFFGTMAKPTNSTGYGTVLGYANYKGTPTFNNFYYDTEMCDIQTNGMEYGMDGVGLYNGQIPNEDRYGIYGINWSEGGGATSIHPELAAKNIDNITMCNTDNYVICTLLFYITNDNKTFFSASDVTVDFSIDDINNSSTNERVAVFTIPDNVTCVKVDGKHLYPLDPGEVVVTVKWNGLQRKVHLDITYGLDWTGGSNSSCDGGDGTAENPYIIHNADQMNGVLHSTKYNIADVHIKLANDIFFNTHLLQNDGTPRGNAKKWNPVDLKANLDGNGKTIYGLYVNKDMIEEGKSLGVFNNLYGTVNNLAIVDSDVSTNTASYADTNMGLLCGIMKEGSSVSNCLFHGRVSGDSYCGGITSLCENNTSITDCFTNVHLTWPAEGSHPQGAGGICFSAPSSLENCIATGRVEKFAFDYGIAQGRSKACYFDQQMQAGAKNGSYIVQDNVARTTDQLVNGNLMKGFSAWQQEAECYPMLKTFANTPYGKLLAMPIYFNKKENDNCYSADRAGDVNYIFEFPMEDVTWSALHEDTYLDVINECGAASIVKRTDDNVEILIAQAENVESQCTRAMRTLPLNLRSGLTSFLFKDPIAQTAAEAAFDTEEPKGILTLRELVEATKDKFEVFNREATGLQFFPEFRFFTTTEILEEGMLSGLNKLCELQLPKRLHTIDTNAFNGCTSLDEITVPATFTTMNEGGLYGSGIKNVLVNPKHKTMESIDGSLFEVDNIGKKHLVVYPPGRNEKDATISTQFDVINDYAFYKIPELMNIYIDNCLPEGNLVVTDGNNPIVHANDGEIIDVYVNDGSYDKNGNKDMHILFDEYLADSFWGEYYEAGKLHIYYPLTVTEGGWATLYIGFPTLLPKGLIAYVAPKDINTLIEENEDKVILNSIGRIIPKTTPVVVRAEEPGLYKLLLYEGTPPDLNKYENKLIGSYIGQTEMGIRQWGVQVYQEDSQTGGALTLGHNNSTGEVGFFKYNGKEIPPYRAYLGYTNIIEQNANARFMFYIDDIPQGITTGELLPQNKNQSDEWYDLSGRKLNGKPTKKGVYIHNGRAVVR